MSNNPSLMKNARILSLLLALAINALPLARLGITTLQTSLRPGYAVLFQWTGISAALLGSYDAVSGASTFITSPNQATGKVGEPFSYRITSAPDQGNVFSADPLPAGLSLGTGKRRSFIEGTPAEAGTFAVTIVASDDNRASRTISKTLTMTIDADVLPVKLLNTPPDQSIETGQDLFLSVLAVGTEPIRYQWFHNDLPLADQKSAVLKLRAVEPIHSGSYHVTIENPVNTITSNPAQITISTPEPPIPPQINRIFSIENGIELEISGAPNSVAVIEFCESIEQQIWQTLNTVTLPNEGSTRFTDQGSSSSKRFYRTRLE
jgi:hypothetical protein